MAAGHARTACGRLPGPGLSLFPAGADPDERPVRVKDRAAPGRRQPAPQASLIDAEGRDPIIGGGEQEYAVVAGA
jgi:hypothetical protein